MRDYIHVSDLAAIHVAALNGLENGAPDRVLNCGSGRGVSVREALTVIRRGNLPRQNQNISTGYRADRQRTFAPNNTKGGVNGLRRIGALLCNAVDDQAARAQPGIKSSRLSWRFARGLAARTRRAKVDLGLSVTGGSTWHRSVRPSGSRYLYLQ